ncbi:MAG: ABC transporter ATP-binding protein [Deltaproteobacteria bacterium]|nr:ABC transporter ATP-binding protein [Deltaproteobacteria bacterium]
MTGMAKVARILKRTLQLLAAHRRTLFLAGGADLWATAVVLALSAESVVLLSGGRAPDFQNIFSLILLLTLLITVRWGQAMARNRLEHGIAADLREQAISEFLDQPRGSGTGAGELVQKLLRDGERAASAIASIPRAFVASPLLVAGLSGFLIWHGAAVLAAGALLMALPATALAWAIGGLLARRARLRSESEAHLASLFGEAARGAELLHAVPGGDAVLKALAKRSRELELRSAPVAGYGVLATGIGEALRLAALVGALWILPGEGLSREQMGLIPALWFLLGAMTGFFSAGIGLAPGLEALSRLPEPSLREPETFSRTWKSPPQIEFAGLVAGYRQDRPVFKNVSAVIGPGSWTAVTGPSGSGKTTLVRVLTGLLAGFRGDLQVDGIPLNQITPASRRRLFVLLTQEPIVLGLTLRENFRLSAPEVSDEDIRAALVQVGLDGRVGAIDLDKELDPSAFSGGEKERMAFARLLVSDSPVAILDEPGVFLDRENEDRVVSLLKELKGKKTLITITHNPRLLNLADQVIELEDGISRLRFNREAGDVVELRWNP